MKLGRIVVAGGSIAALTSVDTLRIEGFDGSITVISDEKVPPYTRVPLSKGVLAGTESEDDLALGTPTISKGSLDCPPALLEWRVSGTTGRVVALNYGIRPAQLKRLVPADHP